MRQASRNLGHLELTFDDPERGRQRRARAINDAIEQLSLKELVDEHVRLGDARSTPTSAETRQRSWAATR
jgi:uncharacterized small protein (DUF1192 family)